MKLWFKKPFALLGAAVAVVACSPDSSNDSITAPPVGEAITSERFVVQVCKVPIREDDVTMDPDAAGIYDFTYQIDDGPVVPFQQESVEEFPSNTATPETDCISTVYRFEVPNTASSLEITELTKQFGDGYAELWRIAVTANQGCEATTNLVNDGTTAGSVTLDFLSGDCSAGVKIFFKNRFIPEPPDGGTEGCTPGAWRNQDGTGNNGKNRWIGTGYELDDSFEGVFGDIGPDYDDLTLRQALDFNDNSGGLALIKHATAALLNAAHPDVDYPYSVDQVISMFQAAWADLEADNNATKDMFDEANNLGCPI